MIKKEAFPNHSWKGYKMKVISEVGERHNNAHIEVSTGGRSGIFIVNMTTFEAALRKNQINYEILR